jgi:hypothetical protein
MRFSAILLLAAAPALALDPMHQEPLAVTILEKPDGVPQRRTLQRDAMPGMEMAVEATGLDPSHLALEVNGLLMDVAENTNGAAPFRAMLHWWPWQGNGTYAIAAIARSWTAPDTFVTSRVLKAKIDGLHHRTPAPQVQVIKLYQERFGLKLTHPALARHVEADPAACRWVSAAYIENTLYEIHLFDDLRVVARARPVNRPASGGEQPVTRPAGRYKMLVVFVNRGQAPLSEPEALLALQAARDEMEDTLARGAARFGSTTPILMVDVFGAYARAEPATGPEILSPAAIASLTRKDPAAYHLIAQVELDPAKGVAARTLRGFDGRKGSGVNIWMRAPDKDHLATVLSRVLLDHQLNRAFGWDPAWPRGDGGFTDNNPVADSPPSALPSLLYGWADLDGDRIPEILDMTPYGREP